MVSNPSLLSQRRKAFLLKSMPETSYYVPSRLCKYTRSLQQHLLLSPAYASVEDEYCKSKQHAVSILRGSAMASPEKSY